MWNCCDDLHIRRGWWSISAHRHDRGIASSGAASELIILQTDSVEICSSQMNLKWGWFWMRGKSCSSEHCYFFNSIASSPDRQTTVSRYLDMFTLSFSTLLISFFVRPGLLCCVLGWSYVGASGCERSGARSADPSCWTVACGSRAKSSFFWPEAKWQDP